MVDTFNLTCERFLVPAWEETLQRPHTDALVPVPNPDKWEACIRKDMRHKISAKSNMRLHPLRWPTGVPSLSSVLRDMNAEYSRTNISRLVSELSFFFFYLLFITNKTLKVTRLQQGRRLSAFFVPVVSSSSTLRGAATAKNWSQYGTRWESSWGAQGRPFVWERWMLLLTPVSKSHSSLTSSPRSSCVPGWLLRQHFSVTDYVVKTSPY